MLFRTTVLLMSAASLFAQEPAPDPARVEAGLGAGMAERFRDRHGVLDIVEAQAYLDRIVAELAAAAPGAGPCCAAQIHTGGVDAPASPEALPGGYLFVPARRFLSASDERAFVERVAHAVAHARARDWAMPHGLGPEPPFPIDFYVVLCDKSLDVPISRSAEWEARETRAVETASSLAEAAKLGTGEFERVRALVEGRIGALPFLGPVTAPSLLP